MNEPCTGSRAWLREVTEDEAFKKSMTVTCEHCGRKLKAKQSYQRVWEGRSQTIIDYWRMTTHGTVPPMTKAEAQERLPGYYLHNYLADKLMWYAAYRELMPGFIEEKPVAVSSSWDGVVELVERKAQEAK